MVVSLPVGEEGVSVEVGVVHHPNNADTPPPTTPPHYHHQWSCESSVLSYQLQYDTQHSHCGRRVVVPVVVLVVLVVG